MCEIDVNKQYQWQRQTEEESTLEEFLENKHLLDCTLSCPGKQFKAHRIILRAHSPVLRELFAQQRDSHPIILLKNIKENEMYAIIDYIYKGKALIKGCDVEGVLKAAKSLEINLQDSYLVTEVSDDEENGPSRKRGKLYISCSELLLEDNGDNYDHDVFWLDNTMSTVVTCDNLL